MERALTGSGCGYLGMAVLRTGIVAGLAGWWAGRSVAGGGRRDGPFRERRSVSGKGL